MQVITLSKTKELLGLSVTTYDAEITAKIPYVDSVVKQITNNIWNWQIDGNTTDGSPYIEIGSIRNYAGCQPDDIYEYIEIGMLAEGENIPSGAYVSEIYTPLSLPITLGGAEYTTPVIKLSGNATADETAALIYLGIPIGYQVIIAKGIWYMIQQTSTTLPEVGISSRSFGPLSVDYSEKDSQIDGRYGMPSWFVKSFPQYHRGH